MPSIVDQLFLQEDIHAKHKVRLDFIPRLCNDVSANTLENTDHYRNHIGNLLVDLKQSSSSRIQTQCFRDDDLGQLRHDIRKLDELLTRASALRSTTFPLHMYDKLSNALEYLQDNLQGSLQVLALQPPAEPIGTMKLAHEIDRIEHQMIDQKFELLSDNCRYLELSTILQDLRRQYPSARLLQPKPKSCYATSRRVYVARKKLNQLQPAYAPDDIDCFRRKIEICRNEVALLNDPRKFIIANMTLPCVDKMIAAKFRLVSQMVAHVPSLLEKPGTIRLNFLYDQSTSSHETVGADTFKTDNVVGLKVNYVDEEQNPIHCSEFYSTMLPHLIFFVSFLATEQCNLLLLDDTFANLTREEKQDAFKSLNAIAQNMQIIAVA